MANVKTHAAKQKGHRGGPMITFKLSLLARVRRHIAKSRVAYLQQRQCDIRAEIVESRKELAHLANLQATAERHAGLI